MSSIIKSIEFTRKNKIKKMDVLVQDNGHGTIFINKADGKPFYGVIGHLSDDGKNIVSYYRKTIVSDVKGLEEFKIN